MSVPQNPNPHGPAEWPPPQHTAEPRKPRRWPWILGMVGTFALGFVIAASATEEASYREGYSRAMADGVQGSHQNASQPYTPPAVDPAPMPSAPLVTEPAEIMFGISDGMYQVGTDMEPGRYKTVGPASSAALDMCYWARNSDDSGELDSIIANDNISGPGSVTIKAGEFAEFSGGCTWEKQ